MRLEGLHRAFDSRIALCGISVATQLPHNPRLKLLRFSERRLSWRITAMVPRDPSPTRPEEFCILVNSRFGGGFYMQSTSGSVSNQRLDLKEGRNSGLQ